MTDERDDVIGVIERINAAWSTGQPEAMRHELAPSCTFVPPGFSNQAEGREACIQSYTKFMEYAQLTRFRATDYRTHVTQYSAVVTFAWEMSWIAKGAEHSDSGHDVWVLERSDGRWVATWRTMICSPGGAS